MKIDVVWSARSKRDMKSLYAWLCERNKKAADKIHGRIEESVELILDKPYMGVSYDVADVRKHPVPDTEFTVFYKVSSDMVVVLRVWHQSQDIPELFNDDVPFYLDVK